MSLTQNSNEMVRSALKASIKNIFKPFNPKAQIPLGARMLARGMAYSSKGRGAGFGPAHTAHGPANPHAKQHEPPCSAGPPCSPKPPQTQLQARKPATALRWLGNDPALQFRFVGRPQRACCLQNAPVRFALGKLLS